MYPEAEFTVTIAGPGTSITTQLTPENLPLLEIILMQVKQKVLLGKYATEKKKRIALLADAAVKPGFNFARFLNNYNTMCTVGHFCSLPAWMFQVFDKERGISLAREIAWYICNTYYGIPYDEIGNHFGGRNHSTIRRGANSIKDEIQVNADRQQQVNQIINLAFSVQQPKYLPELQ